MKIPRVPLFTRPQTRRLAGLLATLVVGGMLLFTTRGPILRSLGSFLIVADSPRPSDLVLVLNGSEENRAQTAARLITDGFAPKILVPVTASRPSVTLGLVMSSSDITVALLTAAGVPRENIEIISGDNPVTSTRDEALALKAHLDQHPSIRRVTVVTSLFHTRRTRWIVRRVLRDWEGEMMLVGAQHNGFDTREWWKSERGLVSLNNEYIKLVFYWLKY